MKPPYKGVWRVDVMEDYPNVVQVILCKDRRSVPLDCRKDYNVTMTTSTGRKKTITDYMNTSFGVIQPHEFPLTIDVSVTPLNTNNRLEFSLQLLYPNFHYEIMLYDESSNMQGGIH